MIVNTVRSAVVAVVVVLVLLEFVVPAVNPISQMLQYLGLPPIGG
jgi:uncharacterized membrane protein